MTRFLDQCVCAVDKLNACDPQFCQDITSLIICSTAKQENMHGGRRSLLRIFISMCLIFIVFCAYHLIRLALIHPKSAGFNKQTQLIKEFGDTSPENALQREVSVSDNPRWMPLDKGPVTAFVYSACYDDVEPTPFVRVQASVSLPWRQCSVNIPVKCLYFEDDINQPTGVTRSRLRSYTPAVDGESKCKGAVAQCPLLGPQHRPKAVALVTTGDTDQTDVRADNTKVSSVLHVHYGAANERQDSRGATGKGGARSSASAEEEKKKWNITRCYPALYGFRDSVQILQNVEIGLALGINHFVFYNFSIDNPQVNTLLRYYQQIGVAEVLDWHHPEGKNLSHNHDQFAAIQDCLHRHLRTSRFILFSDLDEVPLPRTTSNLASFLMEQFARQPQCGGFRFLNTFYDTLGNARSLSSKTLPLSLARSLQNLHDSDLKSSSHVMDSNLSKETNAGKETRQTKLSSDTPWAFDDQRSWEFAQHHGLKFFLSPDRENYVYPKRSQRCKQVVIPSRIREISVHSIYSFRGPYQRCWFSRKVALLNHYRKQTKTWFNTMGYVEDLSLLRLAPLVMPRIQRTLNRLNWTRAVLS